MKCSPILLGLLLLINHAFSITFPFKRRGPFRSRRRNANENCGSPLNSTALVVTSSNSTSLRLIFTEELCSLLADDVKERVDLPFIPETILAAIIDQSLQKLATHVSPEILKKIELMLAAAATESPYDDMGEAERNQLADEVAKEISQNVAMPMLVHAQQEDVVLQRIFRAVFAILTTKKCYAKDILVAELDMVLRVFKDPSSRKLLVDAINKIVDIPMLNEHQEAIVFDTLIDRCADILEWILPVDFGTTLRDMPVDGVEEMKVYLVDTINSRINIPMLNEDQEQALIQGLVTILMDSSARLFELEENEGDNTTMTTNVAFMLLSEEGQQQQLIRRCEQLEQDMVQSKRDFKAKYASLKAQLRQSRNRLSRGGMFWWLYWG